LDAAERVLASIRVPLKAKFTHKEYSPDPLCRQRSTEQVRGLLQIRHVAYYALPESVTIGPGLSTILRFCRRSPLGALRSVKHGGILEIYARRYTEAVALP
jgi:hypothetical protein